MTNQSPNPKTSGKAKSRSARQNQNKLIRTLFIVVICYLLFGASTAQAQSTDTPVASAEAIKEDINRHIQEAIEKNLKNTQEVLAAKESQNRIVGYSGSISDIKQGFFTLTSSDATLQVSLDQTTKIIKDSLDLKPELISIRDRAIVIGTITASDIINAKRIILFTQDKPKYEKRSFFSPVIKVDTVKKVLTLKIDGDNQVVGLGKLIKLGLSDLTAGQNLFGIIMTNVETGTVTLIQAKII